MKRQGKFICIIHLIQCLIKREKRKTHFTINEEHEDYVKKWNKKV